MEMPQGESDLCDEEAGLVLSEALDLDKVAEQLATLDEAHDEVDAGLVLEDELHVDDEGMLHRVEDVLFELDVLPLLIVNHDVLPDALHGVDLLSHQVLNQVHLAECTLAHHPEDHEVLQPSALTHGARVLRASTRPRKDETSAFLETLYLIINFAYLTALVVGSPV